MENASGYAKPAARLPRLNEIFARIEQWTMERTKFEAMDILNEYDIPCGPILSMKEIMDDGSLYETGTLVKVDHPTRGEYVPLEIRSSCPTRLRRGAVASPGEHTDEILRDALRFDETRIAEIQDSGALGEIQRQAAE